MTTLTGIGEPCELRMAIVLSTYHDFVTNRLRDGALEALQVAGLSTDSVVIASVPGAFEIPQAARRLAVSGRVDAVICLGCLIRGQTPHFDLIASAVIQGITEASLDSGVPMTFGVLTTNSAEEALARARDDPSNKGWEAAQAALSMARLFRQFPPKDSERMG